MAESITGKEVVSKIYEKRRGIKLKELREEIEALKG